MGDDDYHNCNALVPQKDDEIERLNANISVLLARVSNLQTRYLHALDALDEAQRWHADEIKDCEQKYTRLARRVRKQKKSTSAIEAERDDLRDSVLELVEKVEKSNDIRSWPFNRLQLTKFAEHSRHLEPLLHQQPSRPLRSSSSSHQLPTGTSEEDSNQLGYAGAIIERLRRERDDERVAHRLTQEDFQSKIDTLVAQLARREAELEFYATHGGDTNTPTPTTTATTAAACHHHISMGQASALSGRNRPAEEVKDVIKSTDDDPFNNNDFENAKANAIAIGSSPQIPVPAGSSRRPHNSKEDGKPRRTTGRKGGVMNMNEEGIITMLNMTAARNRALEVEIKTLFQRLQQARSTRSTPSPAAPTTVSTTKPIMSPSASTSTSTWTLRRDTVSATQHDHVAHPQSSDPLPSTAYSGAPMLASGTGYRRDGSDPVDHRNSDDDDTRSRRSNSSLILSQGLGSSHSRVHTHDQRLPSPIIDVESNVFTEAEQNPLGSSRLSTSRHHQKTSHSRSHKPKRELGRGTRKSNVDRNTKVDNLVNRDHGQGPMTRLYQSSASSSSAPVPNDHGHHRESASAHDQDYDYDIDDGVNPSSTLPAVPLQAGTSLSGRVAGHGHDYEEEHVIYGHAADVAEADDMDLDLDLTGCETPAITAFDDVNTPPPESESESHPLRNSRSSPRSRSGSRTQTRPRTRSRARNKTRSRTKTKAKERSRSATRTLLEGLDAEIEELSSQIDAFRHEREKLSKVVFARRLFPEHEPEAQSEGRGSGDGRCSASSQSVIMPSGIANVGDDDGIDGSELVEGYRRVDGVEVVDKASPQQDINARGGHDHAVGTIIQGEDKGAGVSNYDALVHRLSAVEEECLILRQEIEEQKVISQFRENELRDEIQALQNRVNELDTLLTHPLPSSVAPNLTPFTSDDHDEPPSFFELDPNIHDRDQGFSSQYYWPTGHQQSAGMYQDIDSLSLRVPTAGSEDDLHTSHLRPRDRTSDEGISPHDAESNSPPLVDKVPVVIPPEAPPLLSPPVPETLPNSNVIVQAQVPWLHMDDTQLDGLLDAIDGEASMELATPLLPTTSLPTERTRSPADPEGVAIDASAGSERGDDDVERGDEVDSGHSQEMILVDSDMDDDLPPSSRDISHSHGAREPDSIPYQHENSQVERLELRLRVDRDDDGGDPPHDAVADVGELPPTIAGERNALGVFVDDVKHDDVDIDGGDDAEVPDDFRDPSPSALHWGEGELGGDGHDDDGVGDHCGVDDDGGPQQLYRNWNHREARGSSTEDDDHPEVSGDHSPDVQSAGLAEDARDETATDFADLHRRSPPQFQFPESPYHPDVRDASLNEDSPHGSLDIPRIPSRFGTRSLSNSPINPADDADHETTECILVRAEQDLAAAREMLDHGDNALRNLETSLSLSAVSSPRSSVSLSPTRPR